MLRAQDIRAGAATRTRAGRGLRRPKVGAAAAVRLPAHVAPMLATAPDDIPSDARKYNFEWKWDGVRALAYIEGSGGGVRLESRNLRDITVAYPELQALAGAVSSGGVLLDGEIV